MISKYERYEKQGTMSVFSFRTDKKSEAFCLRIAQEMRHLFNMSETEAIKRINRQCMGKEWVGPNHVYYHESADEWAKFIYYEGDSYWWMEASQPRPKPSP